MPRLRNHPSRSGQRHLICGSVDCCDEGHADSTSLASCPICLDTVDPHNKTKTGKSVVLKPCNHVFHRRCAKQWFVAEVLRGKATPSCPLCRSQVEPNKSPMASKTQPSLTSRTAGRAYRLFAKVMARVIPGNKSRRRHQEAAVLPTLRLYLSSTPSSATDSIV